MAVKTKTLSQHVLDAGKWLALANLVLVVSAALLQRPDLFDARVQSALTVANLIAVAVVKFLDPETPNR